MLTCTTTFEQYQRRCALGFTVTMRSADNVSREVYRGSYIGCQSWIARKAGLVGYLECSFHISSPAAQLHPAGGSPHAPAHLSA